MLSGCTSNQTKNSQDVDITKISTEESTEQDISNRAKDVLKQYDHITSVAAVNTKNKLLIGVSVKHGSRFHLKSLRKKWEKKIKETLPKMDVKLTTDRKIIWELSELETKLNNASISKDGLQKSLKKIIKLMNENA